MHCISIAQHTLCELSYDTIEYGVIELYNKGGDHVVENISIKIKKMLCI